MEPEEDDLGRDKWFLKPRASDEMELTEHSFKAFGRLLILKLEATFIDEESEEENL